MELHSKDKFNEERERASKENLPRRNRKKHERVSARKSTSGNLEFRFTLRLAKTEIKKGWEAMGPAYKKTGRNEPE